MVTVHDFPGFSGFVFCSNLACTKNQQYTDKTREHNGPTFFLKWLQLRYILYSICTLLPHYLRQLLLSRHPTRIDTDDVSEISIVITCLFHRVGHHFHFRLFSCVWYTRVGFFLCWSFLSGRWIQIHFSDPTAAVLSGMGQCCKFLIPPSYPLFPASLFRWCCPSWFMCPVTYPPCYSSYHLCKQSYQLQGG